MNELIREAKNCKNCLGWHHHCNAECCRVIYINMNPSILKRSGKYLIVGKNVTQDMKWYYSLRGIIVGHGILKIPKENCVASGNRILYIKNCDLLEGVLCKGHPDKKPKYCQDFDENNFNSSITTENCLLRYKNMEENTNE